MVKIGHIQLIRLSCLIILITYLLLISLEAILFNSFNVTLSISIFILLNPETLTHFPASNDDNYV